MKIIKRNGAEVVFDIDKIIMAVTKANDAVDEKVRMTPLQIERISQSVQIACEEMGRSPSVEEIQDLVEKAIMAHGAFEVAKEYITYRYTRSLLRQSNTTDDRILSLIECNNEEVKQENANKNPTINAVQRDYMAGEVSKDITSRILLPKEVVDAHEAGIIHFHDADYYAQHMHNCDLVNLEDMLQNGTVISGTLIEKPHSFSTACNIATQIIAQVASNQYGGQSISLTHLAPFVQVSREKIRKTVEREMAAFGVAPADETISKVVEDRLREEVRRGVQTIQYQVVTLMTTNGQAPFITVFMYLNESDNAVLIAGLSRMKLTDKTTQEYLNYFSERGIDVYEALSKWGDAAAVAEKVTRGEIRGSEAVEEILAYMQEQYGGLSEQMAGTYAGMVDNLADAEANAEAAYGEGYNEKRKEGIQAQMDWLNSGAMDEANRAIGAWQAELENTKEQYQREAMEAMMETDEYQQAQAEGDAAEMGRLIMQAKVQGMNEYNASEGAQLALESELALAAAIRDDARSDQAYWDAGYRKSQEYSKGLAAGMASALVGTGSETTTGLSVEERRYGNWRRGGYYDEDGVWRSHAAGLERVPYDGYAALLHEGERVLTAREARQADQGGGAQVTITGNTFQVRQESDIDAIAEALYRKLRLAQMGGVR